MTSTTPIDGLADWLRDMADSHDSERLSRWASAVESLALERIAVPEGQAQRCPTCGEDEPFTGTCGTSDSDTRALCKRIAAPQAVPAQAELSDDEIVRLWIDHYPAEFNEGNACNVTRAILSARKDRADALLLMAEQALDFHGDHGETYAAIRTYLASVPHPQDTKGRT